MRTPCQHHLQMLWRFNGEPIIALDGDTAGLRAAYRVIDLALPLLEAGRGLRFAIMPQGQDPDDVIRARGAGAMQELIEQAQPMVNLLWQRETENKIFDSPERKAALDKDLRGLLAKIADQNVRGHYADAIKQMRWDLFGPKGRSGQGGGKWTGRNRPAPVLPTTKTSVLVNSDTGFEDHLREAVILATLICHPDLIEGFEAELEHLEFRDPDHQRLQGALLTHYDVTDPQALRVAIDQTIGPGPLENLFALRHVQINPAVRNTQDQEAAQMALAEAFAKLTVEREHAVELDHAQEEMHGVPNEALTWHLRENNQAREAARRGDTEDKGEYDIGPNGARLNRDERDAFNKLLDQLGIEKPQS